MHTSDAIFDRFLVWSVMRTSPFMNDRFLDDDDRTVIPETNFDSAFGDADLDFSPAFGRGSAVERNSLIPSRYQQFEAPRLESDVPDDAAIESIRLARSRGGRGGASRGGGGAAARRRTPTPTSAVEQADALCGPLPVLQPQRSGEPLPGPLGALYPHVTRLYTEDQDAFAAVAWTDCSASNLWAIITSPHLVSGASRSMAWFLNFAVRTQLTGTLKHFLGPARLAAFQPHLAGTRGIQPTAELERLFVDCCNVAGVRSALTSSLCSYNITEKHVIRFKAGVFPEVSSVHQWLARLAACMIDPAVHDMMHAMSNAQTVRLAVDQPALRINNVKFRAIEKFTADFVNNPAFVPVHNPSVREWCDVDYDASVVGTEPRSWVWVGQKMAWIKRNMGQLLKNFNKSGEGENDVEDCDRDLDFYENFAHRDPLLLWIYLCWNHGREVPSWATALLPDGEDFDIGGDEQPAASVTGRTPKKPKPDAPVDWAGFVASSTAAMEAFVSNARSNAVVAHHHYPPASPSVAGLSQGTNGDALSVEQKRALDLAAIKQQLTHLVDMRNMLPQEMQASMDDDIRNVTAKVRWVYVV